MDAILFSLDSNHGDTSDNSQVDEQVRLDPATFAALYEQHLHGIYRYIRARTRSDEDAIDLAHQVFVSALEALPRYRYRGVPLQPWLYRIARNAVIDFHRRSRTSVPWDSSSQALHLRAGDEVETSILQKERAERLLHLLDDLDADKREVLALRFASGLKVREIAVIVGRSEAAVKTEIRRSLRTLRKHYEEEHNIED